MKKELKKRLLRLYIGCVCPIFLFIVAIVILFLGYVFLEGNGVKDIGPLSVGSLLAMSSFVFVFFVIPAIIYSCLMEFIINPRVADSRWVIVINIFLGFLCAHWLLPSELLSAIYYIVCGVAGCLVGFFSGVWVRFTYLTYLKKQRLPTLCITVNTVVSLYFIVSAIVGIWLFLKAYNLI